MLNHETEAELVSKLCSLSPKSCPVTGWFVPTGYNDWQMETFLKYFAIPGLCGIAAWIGGFFGAYAKKKGENLATHRDIQTLTKDLETTTTAVKKVEANISTDMWARQRKWDVKKEAIFELVKELATVHWITAELAIPVLREEAKFKMVEALNAYRRAESLALVVCNKQVCDQFPKIFSVSSALRGKL